MRSLMMCGAVAAVMLSAATLPARADDFLQRLLGQHHRGDYWDYTQRQHAQDWRWRQPTRGSRGPIEGQGGSAAIVKEDPVDKE